MSAKFHTTVPNWENRCICNFKRSKMVFIENSRLNSGLTHSQNEARRVRPNMHPEKIGNGQRSPFALLEQVGCSSTSAKDVIPIWVHGTTHRWSLQPSHWDISALRFASASGEIDDDAPMVCQQDRLLLSGQYFKPRCRARWFLKNWGILWSGSDGRFSCWKSWQVTFRCAKTKMDKHYSC